MDSGDHGGERKPLRVRVSGEHLRKAIRFSRKAVSNFAGSAGRADRFDKAVLVDERGRIRSIGLEQQVQRLRIERLNCAVGMPVVEGSAGLRLIR